MTSDGYSYTFRATALDRLGCTKVPKDVFKNVLELTHADHIRVKRVSGPEYDVSSIKCASNGRTFYQLDLSDAGLHTGSMVTLTPGEEHNEVSMAVVEPAASMWERRGVVDAIADLQRRVTDLEDAVWE